MKHRFNNDLERFDCIAPLIIGAGILGGTALAGGAISSILSKKASDKSSGNMSDTQEKINAQNIAFQERENAITREREDNAHVREVLDLQRAGLSPLANLSGASSQALTAPQADATGYLQGEAQHALGAQNLVNNVNSSFQNAVNNFLSLQNAQVQTDVGNSQVAFNNARTEEQNITNSTLAFKNLQEILKLQEQVKGLETNNEIERIRKENYQKFLDAEIANMSASASNSMSQKALHDQQYQWNKDNEKFYNDLGIPKGTSTSFSVTSPIGATMVNSREIASAIADSKQTEEVRKNYLQHLKQEVAYPLEELDQKYDELFAELKKTAPKDPRDYSGIKTYKEKYSALQAQKQKDRKRIFAQYGLNDTGTDFITAK